MKTQQKMGIIWKIYFSVMVILLGNSASVSSDDRMRTDEVLFSQLVDPTSVEIDWYMADTLWLNCKVDLIKLKEAIEELDLCLPEKTSSDTNDINMKWWSMDKESILKMISLLHPEVKQNLLDCLRKNDIIFRVSGEEEDGSKTRYTRYAEFIFPKAAARRNLGTKSLHWMTKVSAAAPPVGSPSPASSPSQAYDPRPPAASPKMSFFPPNFVNSNIKPPPDENSALGPDSGANVRAKKHNSKHKPVIIAVVTTAFITFIVAALFFLCCSRFCGGGSKMRQNDENPLLSLSMSDFSVGSFAMGNSIKEEKGHKSFGNNSSYLGKASSLDGNFNTEFDGARSSLNGTPSLRYMSTNSNAKVPPPPGGVASSMGLPPLNPPPGRADPLPPEPRSFFRAPPSKTGPRPPPQSPAPLSSAKPSSISSPSLPGGVASSMGLPPLKPPPGRADPLPPEPRYSFRAPPSKTGPHPPPQSPAPLSSAKPSSISGPSPPGPPHPPPPPPITSGSRPGPHTPPPPISSGSRLGPHPPPPPIPSSSRPGPRPPPPRPPTAAPIGSKLAQPPPPAPNHPSNASRDEGDGPKTKLKPFFWDKVLANPDQSMVWHQLRAGSFQFDENMIESLFGYAATDKSKNERKKEKNQDSPPQFIQIIDSKKSQNLSILLRALNVTNEEVCDALDEGNELPSEFLQTLLKMAPTREEELKLRMFNGQLSQLGPADRFLKALVDIPFAFKRLETLLFMCTVQEEIATTQESFATFEIACKELRNSRLFLKLLEAVLKTGNRMNDGTFRGGAQAFKLDTLLKLSDVKGTDGKTTLLHFVVQEIIRSEGIRAARMAKQSKSFSSIKTEDVLQEALHETDEHYCSLGLEAVSRLGNELENVKKAANLDANCLIGTVAKISHGLQKSKEFLNSEMKQVEEENGFHQALKSFVQDAEGDIKQLMEEEKRIMTLVKSTGDYFHGNAGKDEGLRLFVIVRDFLVMLDKACREVRETHKKQTKKQKKETSAPDTHNSSIKSSSSSETRSPPSPHLHQKLFPAILDRRMGNSSSDEESS